MGQAEQATPQGVDFAVAMWMGMPRDEVLRGLREGWVRPPAGASSDWRPFEAPSEAVDDGAKVPQDGSVRRWLARLDDSLDDARLAGLWREAGGDDAARALALRRFVTRALGLEASASDASVEAELANADGRGRIVSLPGLTGEALASLARKDGAVRAALATRSDWALTGDGALRALADPAGHFHRFDPDSGERRLSESWIEDRVKHAQWRWASPQAWSPGEQGPDGWRFVDRAADAEDEVRLAPEGGVVHQVIFARDDGDIVRGGEATDRIHGGRGDDVLRGRGGRDLLDGGAGDDLLLGGAEADDLDGGTGDDDLDGGAGDDRLAGGGGDDELVGGTGHDLLVGGAGHDVYVVDRGEGVDVIDDDDGTLRIDGVAMAGTMAPAGAQWQSGDGAYRFRLEGDGADRSLVIATREGGDVAEVRHWRPGRFGIQLAGLQALGAGEGAASPGLGGGQDANAASASDPNLASPAEAASAPASGLATTGEPFWPHVVSPSGLVAWDDFADALAPSAPALSMVGGVVADAGAPSAATVAEAMAGATGDSLEDAAASLPAYNDAGAVPWWHGEAFDAPPPPGVTLRHTR